MHRYLRVFYPLAMFLFACSPSKSPKPLGQEKVTVPPPRKIQVHHEAVVHVPLNKTYCFIERMVAAKTSVRVIKRDILKETIGGLSCGMDSKAVVKIVGEPVSKTKPKEEVATGSIISTWDWPKKGLSIDMDTGKTKSEVLSIKVKAPFKGKTSCGIGVGSSLKDAEKIYGKYLDVEYCGKGSMTVGSIYSGIVIDYDETGVTSMFFGASAE